MNAKERMEAAINLKPVDKVPNAPFTEAPVCQYFGSTFRASLLEGPEMFKAHMKSCIIEQIQKGDSAVVDELMTTIGKMIK